MDLNSAARTAAVRGLTRHFLTPEAVDLIVATMIGSQPEEWERILDRCGRGEVCHLYVLVSHREHGRIQTFLYAPGEQDNVADVIDLMGARVYSGFKGDQNYGRLPQPGTYSVSCFDIGSDIRGAVEEAQ
jgi:hypothetical protein